MAERFEQMVETLQDLSDNELMQLFRDVNAWDGSYEFTDGWDIDADGNIVNATHLHDPYWEYRGSAYMAWEEMERDITDSYNHVGYGCEEMDVAEFHQTFDGKF